MALVHIIYFISGTVNRGFECENNNMSTILMLCFTFSSTSPAKGFMAWNEIESQPRAQPEPKRFQSQMYKQTSVNKQFFPFTSKWNGTHDDEERFTEGFHLRLKMLFTVASGGELYTHDYE